MTQQEQYWKERCEAAEEFIMSTVAMEQVAISGKDDQRCLLDKWNVKYHTPEPPVPAQGVEEAAKRYVEKEYPFVWPLNKKGEPITQLVGQKNPPFSRKHRLMQDKHIKTFLAGSRWQQGREAERERLFKSDPVNFLLSNAMRYLNEAQLISLRDALIERTPQPAPTCCARWVKASERLPESGTRIKIFVPETDFVGWGRVNFDTPKKIYYETYKEDFLTANCLWLDESACTCQQELEELRAWKKQATEVMPDFQEIGKEIGIPLGQTVHDKILTGIKKLKEKATVSVIGARWVKASDVKPKEGWHNGKYGGDECVIDVNNGDLIITLPNGRINDNPDMSITEYLDESTCTFPTREQAEEWADKKTGEDITANNVAMSMYDWIIEQINKTKP